MKKTLSFVLILVVVMNIMSFHGFVAEDNVNVSQAIMSAKGKPGTLLIPEIIEGNLANDHVARLKDQEKLNTLHFINADGTFTLYSFDSNVKYIDTQGEIQDKTTVIAETDNGFANKDNDIRVFFPNDPSEGVRLEYAGVEITLTPGIKRNGVQFAKLEEVSDSCGETRERVVYKNVFDSADLIYTPTFEGFKEDIVLKCIPQSNIFEFYIDIGDLALNEYNQIIKNGKVFAEISDIVTIDSKGAYSIGSIHTEPLGDGNYLLTVTVDETFLETALYPVYIDPSIQIDTAYISGVKSIQDAPVYSNKSGNHGANNYNFCGYVSNSYGYGRTLMQFPGLMSDNTFSQLTANQIVNVTLRLREASGKSGTAQINCFAFLDAWSESTVTKNNVNLNNCYYDASYIVGMSANTSPKWWDYNITNIVKGWKNGTFANNGIQLRNSNESSSTYFRNFLATEYTNANYRPYVTVTYNVIGYFSQSTLTIHKNQLQTLHYTVIPDTFISLVNTYDVESEDYIRVLTVNGIAVVEGIEVGQGQVELFYLDYDYGFITLDVMTVVVINTPPPVCTLLVDHTGMTDINGTYHIELNNDSDLPGYRAYDINARMTINNVVQQYDYDITYSFVPDDNNSLLNNNWIDINANTGRVSLHNDYIYNEFAHETGSVTVKVQYIQDPTKVEYVVVDVICEDMVPPTGNSGDQILDVGGRHLRIPFDGIPSNYSSFSSRMSSYSMTSESDEYDFDWLYYDSTEWLAYRQVVNGVKRFKRFFELIRNSRVATIVTHGAPTQISVNSDDDTIYATSGDILELHQGYFKYCNLILLISCSTGSQTNGATSIAEAFEAKGAGAVIAFTNDVIIYKASLYEIYLYEQLGDINNSNTIEDAYENVSVSGCNTTIKGNRTEGYIND